LTGTPLAAKAQKLGTALAEMTRVAVAFSGGLDSSFLLGAARGELGSGNVLALTAVSPLFPRWELEESRALASTLGVRQVLVEIPWLKEPGLVENGPRRCYHCKRTLFTRLLETARQNGDAVLVDGSNTDDLEDYRPGHEAVRELGVRSPLLEAALCKEEIRALSRRMDLPTQDKQPFACLASRFPYGTPLSQAGLARVERCEDLLRAMGFANYRVRSHGDSARIEVCAEEMPRLLEESLRAKLVRDFKEAGFAYVSVDLEGYRTGSMNETLA